MGFVEAYTKTMGHEGGYVNDPDDFGGETYKGISRKYNPSWDGWFIVDAHKGHDDFHDNLAKDVLLAQSVRNFYKERYFDPYVGDDMPDALAQEMFDTSVNMGVGRAVKFLQIALNMLNRNEKLYPDMVEDGDYGNTTHKALYTYLGVDSQENLLKIINILQGMHYINFMKKSPTQEKYARGWLKRVDFHK